MKETSELSCCLHHVQIYAIYVQPNQFSAVMKETVCRLLCRMSFLMRRRENCQVWLKTWSQTQNNTPTWVKGKSNLKGYWNYNYPLVTKQKNGILFTFLPLASRLFRRLENKLSRRLNLKSSGQLVLNII